jgi:hypothetical protein
MICSTWEYRPRPPLYSDAISRDSSWNLTVRQLDYGMGLQLGRYRPFQPPVGGSRGCDLTVVSMKFNRTPLLHTRLDFWQL